jgi:Fic family protein
MDMGSYEKAMWASDPMGPTRKDRASGAFYPYIPDKLSGTEISLSMDAARSCERAAVALSGLDVRSRYVTTAESLSHMLLRSEALSSSRIEGLEMNVRRLLEVEALNELGVSHRANSVEEEVLGNIEAMREAMNIGTRSEVMTLDDVLSMHAALLRHTRLAEYGGALRTTQNWIGGSWYNPLGARYVPPIAERVELLMTDLVSFLETSQLPVVATAAIAHAQLETIHPFVDGNGRTGRALVHAVLRRGGLSTRVVAPISLVLLALKGQYYEALESYRFDSNDESSRTISQTASSWIEFFCHAVQLACERACAYDERMMAVRGRWEAAVHPRLGSATQQLLDALPGNPVISVRSVVRITGKSYPAARAAVRMLEESGILVQTSKNRKSGLYAAREVLDEFTLYERALATSVGDTRMERPVRRVPQRPRNVSL